VVAHTQSPGQNPGPNSSCANASRAPAIVSTCGLLSHPPRTGGAVYGRTVTLSSMSVPVDRSATGSPTGGRIFSRDYSVRRMRSPILVYTFTGDRFHQSRRCFLRPRKPLLAVLGASLLCAGTLSTPAAAETTPPQPESVDVEGARQL